ncbi:carbohydrate ABC transporter permease [Streptosporangium sp. NPDC004379]|uniref:carbohydrate ABC transporter permease n=1 Tax=Streptosporangium sp. NPDC004379 TaxID=3366189 RepID=UPI0036B30210
MTHLDTRKPGTGRRSPDGNAAREPEVSRHPDNRWAALLLAGPLLGLAVFYLWPLARTLVLSFSEGNPFQGYRIEGLGNWAQALKDPHLPRALGNTLLYAGIVLLGVPLAMVTAALMHQSGLRGRGLYRTLYFLPVVTMPAAVAMVWRYIYNGDFGLLNQVLGFFGGPHEAWVADPDTALFAVAVVGVWTTFGTNLVILAAGLDAVPASVVEAAGIDGAGPVRVFRHITAPLLSPSVFLVSTLSVIGSLQMFDLLFIMMGRNNPALRDSKTIVYLFYEEAFVRNDRPLGAVIAIIALAITLVVTAVQFRLQRRWVHYG